MYTNVLRRTSERVCMRPKLFKCAAHFSILESSAQKQQHRRVFHCSCSFVVKLAAISVNYFIFTESFEIFVWV